MSAIGRSLLASNDSDEWDGEDEEDDFDVTRLFRSEGLVSQAKLRVDVAKNISDVVAGDGQTILDTDTVHSRGDIAIKRGSRQREAGSYRREIDDTDMLKIDGGSTVERVTGGVDVHVSVESQVIMGGAYFNTIAGASLRLAGWSDYLIWGAWAEADVLRLELAGISIRASMADAHLIGLRLNAATSLVEDYLLRTDTFGVLIDAQGAVTDLGGAPGGIILEV